MSYNLQIKAFFFNAKTDYLPYYKNFTLIAEKEATAKDLLELIQKQNSDFSYPKQKLIMKINGLVVEAKEPVSNIVDRLGNELTIEPVNSYRSNNGLKINDEDFMQSYAILEPYAKESDLKYYKTLYALHYASETEKFDHAYIGDAVLVLAHKMIHEGNEYKSQILHAITSVDSGLLDCEYENNLFHAQDHTETINTLKKMVKGSKNTPTFVSKMKERFFKKEDKSTVLEIENLEEKQIAYYQGHSDNTAMQAYLKDADIATVKFARAHKLSGLSILEDNRTLAFKKAGATLLDAFDAGAEVLVIEDHATYTMMQKYFKNIENTIGRKILDFELITAEDYLAQLATVRA